MIEKRVFVGGTVEATSVAGSPAYWLAGAPHTYPAELADQLGTSRANLSSHLTCLRECGLVTATAEGRHVRYELADQRLGDALEILSSLDLPGRCDLPRR